MNKHIVFSFTQDGVISDNDENDIISVTITLVYDPKDSQFCLTESSEKNGITSVRTFFEEDKREDAIAEFFRKKRKFFEKSVEFRDSDFHNN